MGSHCSSNEGGGMVCWFVGKRLSSCCEGFGVGVDGSGGCGLGELLICSCSGIGRGGPLLVGVPIRLVVWLAGLGGGGGGGLSARLGDGYG